MIIRTPPRQARRVQQIKSCHCAVYSKGDQSVIPVGLRAASSLVRHQRLAEAGSRAKHTKLLPFSLPCEQDCQACPIIPPISPVVYQSTRQHRRHRQHNTTTPRVVLPDCLPAPEPPHHLSATSATPEQLPCLDARLRRAGRHCRCLEKHHLNTFPTPSHGVARARVAYGRRGCRLPLQRLRRGTHCHGHTVLYIGHGG
jgi:hypothetical protein